MIIMIDTIDKNIHFIFDEECLYLYSVHFCTGVDTVWFLTACTNSFNKTTLAFWSQNDKHLCLSVLGASLRHAHVNVRSSGPNDDACVWHGCRSEPGVQPDGGILPQPLPGGAAAEGSGRGCAAGARGAAAGRQRAQEPADQTRHGRPLHRLQGERGRRGLHGRTHSNKSMQQTKKKTPAGVYVP